MSECICLGWFLLRAGCCVGDPLSIEHAMWLIHGPLMTAAQETDKDDKDGDSPVAKALAAACPCQ